MGQSFSVQTLKIKLKMAISRCNMMINKKSNAIKVSRKEIAQLLIKEKDESARIKVEGVMAEMNMVRVLEIISLMCDLITQRVALVASSTEPPPDLLEAISTIIYCSKRIEVPELIEIATQFQLKWGAKLGPEWYKQHLNNAHKTVSPKVIERLSIQPPDFDAVIEFLKDVAKQYQLDWEPNFERPQEDKDSPDPIGSIAPIRPGGEPPKVGDLDDIDISGLEDVKGMSGKGGGGETDYPGTVNIIVHGCKSLYTDKSIGKVNSHIVISMDGIKPVQESSVDHSGGTEPKWDQEHFPFSVKGAGSQLRIEVYSGDKLLGHALLSTDNLIRNQSRQWFPLHRGDKKAPAGSIDLSTQYMPLRVNPNPVYDRSGAFASVSSSPQPQFSPSPHPQFSPSPQPGQPGMMPGYYYGPPGGHPGMMGPSPHPGFISGPPGGFIIGQPGFITGPPVGPPGYYGPGQPMPIPMGYGSPPPPFGQPVPFQPGQMPFPGGGGGAGGIPLSPQPLHPSQGLSGEPSPSLGPGTPAPAQPQPSVIRIDPHSDPAPDQKEKKESKKGGDAEPEDLEEDGEPGDQQEGDGVPGFEELEKRFKALKNPF